MVQFNKKQSNDIIKYLVLHLNNDGSYKFICIIYACTGNKYYSLIRTIMY